VHGTWVAVVVLLAISGSMGLLIPLAHPGASSAPTVTPAPVAAASTPPTHSDLVVGPGQRFVIQPSISGPTYYQGGNITVEHGGTLIVRNVTLSFVQFVSDSGTPQQRLSHIYRFIDNGTVDFYNATLTTYALVINAYAKLNLTVTADLGAWNSTFAFPGWINVAGSQAVMTLNGSKVAPNPQVAGVVEPSAIYGDTLYAPTVSVTAGATLNLFASQLNGTYADNQQANGVPRPAPLSTNTTQTLTAGLNLTSLYTPTDSANLTLDWSYPAAGARSGYVSVAYTDSNGPGTASTSNNTIASVTVWFAGTAYALGSVEFFNSTAGTRVLSFSPALLAAISQAGMLNYLNYTGDFGVLPARISIAFPSVAGPSLAANVVEFQMNTTGVAYDMTVSGAGSTLSAADSALGLTWNLPPANNDPYSLSAPFPWNSNQLLLEQGANAYLANLSVPSVIPGVFSASAIVPDASSHAYLYRWAQFNLTGRGGNLEVANAHVSAYYAYDTNQSSNNTANSLNALSTADPSIWGYVQYWDSLHGVPSYATSNLAGRAYILLAASDISGSSLPDGLFLGGYHVGITVPAASVGSHWFNWSVSPYPTGVALGTAHYGGSDLGPQQSFAGYYGAMTSTAPVVLASGTTAPNGSVRIGQTLGVSITLVDAGTAIITQVGSTLFYNSSLVHPLGSVSITGLHLTTAGQSVTVNVSWVINDSVTGLHGTFLNTFSVLLDYNGGVVSAGGGTILSTVVVEVLPSQIRVVSVTPPTSNSIDLNGLYVTPGVVQFNGTQAAALILYATPTSGGAPIEIGVGRSLPGSFNITWFPLQQLLSAGTSYTLTVVADYNGVSSAAVTVPGGPYSVPAGPSSPTSFLTQTILGLPLWVWLAIAAAIVVGLVAFLMLARRQAAGKLVECGECGALIPEEATVCPKCGAEFEADLIRCSRCASTIPANSKFCPECAAQLLGKPGEGEADPERQSYADFTEKYRAEGKRELGDNYSEGAFWDWWKRQPSYTSFSQWKLQQGSGTPRAGMTAPPTGTVTTPETAAPYAAPPPKGGGAVAAPPPSTVAPRGTPLPSTGPAAPPPAGGLKACPNCGKEIPPEYLVCPFCGAVTQ